MHHACLQHSTTGCAFTLTSHSTPQSSMHACPALHSAKRTFPAPAHPGLLFVLVLSAAACCATGAQCDEWVLHAIHAGNHDVRPCFSATFTHSSFCLTSYSGWSIFCLGFVPPCLHGICASAGNRAQIASGRATAADLSQVLW